MGQINAQLDLLNESIEYIIQVAIHHNNQDVIQYQDIIKQMIYNAFNDHELRTKLFALIIMLGNDLSGISCHPKVFSDFGKKATIFASSIHGSIALTLPFRKIHILDKIQNGNIFASVFIESILSAPSSLDSLLRSINILFKKYKESFMEYIINQNRKTPNDKTNNLASEAQVKNFFQIRPSDECHFFCSSSDWPDLQLIYISNEYWNVNTSTVNIKEYYKIELGKFLIKHSIPKISNKNAYGTSTNESYLSKFLLDFQKEVNSILSSNKIKFKICY